ncbi:MAG: NifB/NifX family molybdenum-iron cluster-binding protein [Promethearchaeota archaeon]
MDKYSISTEGSNVAEHFGRCPQYTILDVENGSIVGKTIVDNPGHSTGMIPRFMDELGVNVMISGGMGRRAIEFFNQFGIQTILGVSGTVDDVIEEITNGTLLGGESLCSPGRGKDYGLPKEDSDHHHLHDHHHS